MSFIGKLYKTDPKRWIPTVAIIVFLIILSYYSIRDSFLSVWPGWAVIGLTTIAYVGNLIYEYKNRKK